MEGLYFSTREKVKLINEKIERGDFETTEEKQNAKQLIKDIITAFNQEVCHYSSFLGSEVTKETRESSTRLVILSTYIKKFADKEEFQSYQGKFHPFFYEDWKTHLPGYLREVVKRVGFDIYGRFVITLTNLFHEEFDQMETISKAEHEEKDSGFWKIEDVCTRFYD